MELMKKNSTLDYLATPNRQSPVAILLVLLKFVRIIIRQAWPFLLIIIIRGPAKNQDNFYLWLSIGIGGASAILSIIAYFKFYFYVQEDELIIEKGVIQKTKLNIPLDRIQTINFNQNLIHQFFNVVGVELNTAGSKGNEFSITALDQKSANLLREFLISKKKEIAPTQEIDDELHPQPPLPKEELLLKLSPNDLLKVGVGQNHLRTILVIIGGLFGLFQYVEDVIGDDIINSLKSFFGNTAESFFWTLLKIIPLLFLIGFVVTLFNTVLRFYDLRFIKTSLGFKVISGLFTRKERSANLQKIQVIHWSRNPVKKIFGLFDLQLLQAASTALARKQSIYVVGAYEEHVQAVRTAYMPDESLYNFTISGIHKAVIGRRLLYAGLIPTIVLTIVSYFRSGETNWHIGLAWMLFIFINSYFYQKKWKYEISEKAVRLKRGVIGEKSTLLLWYKIQSVSLHQSPYQQRKDLANLFFHTASGTVKIPYIDLAKAQAIRDFAVYKIESSREKWM